MHDERSFVGAVIKDSSVKIRNWRMEINTCLLLVCEPNSVTLMV
jgi:hypothetical protein